MPELWEDPQALRMAEQSFSTEAVQPQSKAKPSKDASLHWRSEAKLAKQRQETRVSKQRRLQRGSKEGRTGSGTQSNAENQPKRE